MSTIHDKFWMDEPNIIIQKNRLTEFFPTVKMSLAEKLNAILRLCIYIAIILFLLKNNINVLYIPLIWMIISFGIYKNKASSIKETYLENKIDHKRREKSCVKPTVDNPFMNINLITDKRDREPACLSFDNPKLQEVIEEKFNHDLYRDVGDLYGKNNSQREFVTMPSTTIPNNQTEFAKWCYSTGSNCKEETIKCAPMTASSLFSSGINVNDLV